ncbi:MAG: phosphatase PAP2 family protein [Verrucomicrobia bacterium]|nr:phosphatase PAP2 family protein [Verrucomicrobiota bacterium]MBV8485803.1 phosphatase PAP2 family protein [Verrucomicrobiota bacterium]
MRPITRPVLTVETTTLLYLFFGAAGAWLLMKSIRRIYKGRLEAIDNAMLRALRRPDNLSIPIGPKWMPQAAKDVTALGSGTNLTIATGILAGFLCLNRRFRATGFLVSSLGSGLLLCQSLKGFFARRRPTVVPHLVDFDPASFPSGHSMGAALVYLTSGGIISRQVTGSLAKTYFLSMALVLAVIVGVSRVYLGVHYPSDVLAGWAAGSLWSSLCAQAARWLQHQGGVEAPMETGE